MPKSHRPQTPRLHAQVASTLRQRILSGVWQNGDSIPTEKELCAEFHIARGTVRQALQTLENEGYLRREQGRGTFVQLTDRNANDSTPRRLAFVVPYVRDSSVSTILIGFQQVAEQANYSVIFNHVNNDYQQQEQVIARLIQDGVSGIALYPVDSEHIGGLDQVVHSGFPLVLIDRYLKGLTSDFVMSDHFGGAIRGVQYLLDQGHRRVGFITWLSPAISMEHRLLGYQQALRERGIEPDPDLICTVEGYPTIDLTPLRAYLSRPNRPTAIFAANDQIAIALYRAAASVGLSVPEDVAVVGFDNLDISLLLDPPLTTVSQPFLKLGRIAAEVLLSRVQGEQGYFRQVTLPAEFIVRESCVSLAREIASLEK